MSKISQVVKLLNELRDEGTDINIVIETAYYDLFIPLCDCAFYEDMNDRNDGCGDLNITEIT